MKSFNMSSITFRCYNNEKEIVNRGILWKESGILITVILQVKKNQNNTITYTSVEPRQQKKQKNYVPYLMIFVK